MRSPKRLEHEPVLFVLELLVVQRLLILDVILGPQEHDRLVARRRQYLAVVAPPHDIHSSRVSLQIGNEVDLYVQCAQYVLARVGRRLVGGF